LSSAPLPSSGTARRRRLLVGALGGLALLAVTACQPAPALPQLPSEPAEPAPAPVEPAPAPVEAAPTAQPSTDQVISGARYVSRSGSDSASGSQSSPWRTIQKGLLSVSAGQTLYVRGGTYTENVKVSASQMRPGTSSSPVRILAYPGERPVIQGLFHLTNPSYWYIEGINVTWNTANSRGSHMVKLLGGTGWRFTNSEVWGARSYAAVLVGNGAKSFRIDNNYIHDTYKSNDLNQDHLIYVDNGQTGNGVIERNVLARSSNGRGVKLGPGSTSQPGTSNIVIRYNTFYMNQGPSNVQFSGSSSNNQVYRNLMDTSGSGRANVTRYQLSGSNNVVKDNLGWGSNGIAEFGTGVVNGGGNVIANPQLANPSGGDFRPTNSAAAGYGAEAP